MSLFRAWVAVAITAVGFVSARGALAAELGQVTLRDAADRVTLSNALVAFDVVKANGDFENLTYRGESLLAEPGYLDWIGPKNNHIGKGAFKVVSATPDQAEVSVTQRYGPGISSPFDVEIHYLLRAGDAGPHVFVVFSHHKGYPEGGVGQSRWVLRLSDKVFNFINIDEDRRYVMPPSDTPTKQLGPKESLMYTDGPFKGQITDKYHCYVDSGDHFFHGWTGTESRLGCWVITGSNESQNGGPTKQHNDAQFGRLLFKILVCGHYGAAGVHVGADEEWQKMYGPWMLYMNHAETNDDLWKDAKRKAEEERAAWPLAFVHHPAYPLAGERGAVTGQLRISDPQDASASPANAWVGLAAAAPSWQQQADGYQFWVHADATGHFSIPAVRPGTYTLYAFTNGVMDEFRRDKVTVGAAAITDLGSLPWQPTRYGKQLWQIGIPDRTAREFRHGDDYRHWGLWNEFPKDFPNGVNFVIGTSNERTDWNYAQVNVQKDGPKGKEWVGTTWNIQFNVAAPPTQGTAILRLALASAHNAKLTIKLNDQPIDSFRTPADNAVIRAGIHGQYSEQDTFFDAKLLRQGDNTISLTQSAGGNAQKSVMYDCLRLELDADHAFDPAIAKAHPHVFPQTGDEPKDAD
jgi:rhamnogalacturonan endolyase